MTAHARIDPAEYPALFALRDAGDPRWPAARDRIVLGNIGLAHDAARTRLGKWGNRLDLDDMVHAGVLGLARAADGYALDGGATFATYAWHCVVNAVNHDITSGGSLVRVPYNNHPICRPLDSVSPGIVGHVRAALLTSPGAPIGGRDGYFAQVPAPPVPCRCEADDQADRDGGRIRDAMATLPDRHRAVVALRFGIGGASGTLADAGRDLGVSRERARQIERDALRRLRDAMIGA